MSLTIGATETSILDKTVGILRQDGAFADFKVDDKSLSALEVMYLSFRELQEMEKSLKTLERILEQRLF